MVFFNYATMQMAAKIVYYGPGLCGKTTNLHYIYQKTSPQSRGEMVSLETETDRTLFFDLLPIDVGVIGGFKTRLQLYTIPGQVFYNTTRKLVLKGVDGLVFVADSQLAVLEANLDSLRNLRENLKEINLNLEDIPLVLQLNKRDLPNIASVETMLNALDPERRFEHVEAVAASGTGVFETLKMVSKLTLRTLRRRMTGEEPARPAPRRDAPTLRVREDGAPLTGRTTAGTTAVPAAPSTSPTVTAKLRATTTVEPSPFDEPPAAEPASTPPETFAEVDSRILSDAPVKPPNYRTGPVPAMSDAEVAEPEVKHVKVRSSVDVMAELEALRKRATQAPPKPARRSVEMPMPEGVTTPREVTRLLALIAAPGVLARSRTLRITVSFEDSERGVIQTQEHSLDLGATSDLQSVTVNLKIDQA